MPPEDARGRTADGRPRAAFLTHLLLACDPALRPARAERMGTAAHLYARTGRLAVRR